MIYAFKKLTTDFKNHGINPGLNIVNSEALKAVKCP